MNNKQKIVAIFTGVLVISGVLLCQTGCRHGMRLSGLVPARGTLTYNGVPVEKANILFEPVSVSGDARICYAVTRSDGRFEMTSLHPGDGVLPGKYKVVVRKIDSTARVETENTAPLFLQAPSQHSAARSLSPKESMARNAASVKHLLPAKYASADSSDLEIEIGKKGDRNIAIDLSD